MPPDDPYAPRTRTEAAPSPKEHVPLAPSLRVADLEHPWLGLESFREETRDYFFGRDDETAELHLRLRSHPLLVLYGRSGLGKTSVLSAGLIPQLRREGQRPLLHRFNYDGTQGQPISQLLFHLGAWGKVKGCPFELPGDFPSQLWVQIHRRDYPPNITHLILDQFEEVFTRGAERPRAENEVRDALAILLQGAIPEPILRLIAEEDNFLDHFDLDSTPVRIILALRDDYVYALNRWRRHLPALGQNNFELRALRGPAAFDAVFKPSKLRCHYRGEVREENKAETGLPPIVSEETARRIVRFVADKGEEVPIEQIEAIPPILSLLCRELNERRFMEPDGTPDNPAGQVTFREGESGIETIVATFYERCLAGRPAAVRSFIEEELVSPYSGARLQQDEKAILKVFEEGCTIPGAADGRRAAGYGDAAAARACLKDLVNQRLLTSLGGENPTYELIHDLLAAVAEKSRIAREQAFETERANLRAEAERKAKNEAEASAREAAERAAVLDAALQKETQARRDADLATRRARWSARAAILVALIAVAACIAALRAREEAKHQRTIALKQTEEVERQRTIALKQTEEAKHQRSIALKQTEEAERQRTIAEKQTEEAVTQRAEADAQKKEALLQKTEAESQRAEADSQKQNAFAQKANAETATKTAQEATEKAVKAKKAADKMMRILLEMQLAVIRMLPEAHSVERMKEISANSAEIIKYFEAYPPEADDRDALRAKGVALTLQGDALLDNRRQNDAVEKYRAALKIDQQLREHDRNNTNHQNDVAIDYNKIGDALRARGGLREALESYHHGLVIICDLVRHDPKNVKWQKNLSIMQKNLSIIYNAIGDTLRDQGDLSRSRVLKNYSDVLVIREKLATQDPANAQWQGNLAFAYWCTGTTWARVEPKSKREARAMVEKGRDILRQLKKRTGLTAEQQKDLDVIEVDLREMGKGK